MRSFVVSVKEETWIPRTKTEVLKELKQGWPTVFGHLIFNHDDLTFDTFPENRALIFPTGYINKCDFVLRASLAWNPGELSRAPTYYDKAVALLDFDVDKV